MRNFFDLAGFEYKKIFMKKSTWVSMGLIAAIIAVMSITTVTGGQFWHRDIGASSYEAMKLDRQVIQSKKGYIDDDFLKEAISQNVAMIENEDNYLINEYGSFLTSYAYIEYVLPYEKAVDIINTVYETDLRNLSTDGFKIFNVTGKAKPIDTLNDLNETDFYSKINQAVKERINNNLRLSDREKEKHLQMLSKVAVPYRNDYTGGYYAFIENSQFIAIMLLVLAAICISPIFAGEYQTRADQLILSSKNGKNTVIYAKLFTGISFVIITVTLSLFAFLLSVLSIHGFSGFDAAIQTLIVYSTYPVTMLQAVLISIGVTIFVSILFTIVTMLLSARFKSPFMAVIISFCILFLPNLFFIRPNGLLFKLLQIFPAKATGFTSIFSEYLYEFFGCVFTPAVFYSVFSIIGTLVILPFIYHSFKNHQVN